MKKNVYIRQRPYTPNYIETVVATVRIKGYQKRYKDITVKLYDTISDTFELNDELGYLSAVRLFKKLGYASVYVKTEHGMRQRMVKNASHDL